jgi:hypothetical protein
MRTCTATRSPPIFWQKSPRGIMLAATGIFSEGPPQAGTLRESQIRPANKKLLEHLCIEIPMNGYSMY